MKIVDEGAGNLANSQPISRSPLPELEMYLTDRLPGFSCTRCARCCTGKLVPVYSSDLERLKSSGEKRCFEETTRLERTISGARYKMGMINKRCVFLDERNMCMHYDLRPNTCRRHPFLVTEKRILVSSTCPGVNWETTQSVEEIGNLSREVSRALDAFLNVRRLNNRIPSKR